MLLSCKFAVDVVLVCHFQSTVGPVICKLANSKFERWFCKLEFVRSFLKVDLFKVDFFGLRVSVVCIESCVIALSVGLAVLVWNRRMASRLCELKVGLR